MKIPKFGAKGTSGSLAKSSAKGATIKSPMKSVGKKC